MSRSAGDFGAAFTELLRAAGTNPDGVRRALPGLVSRSVLYDWKNGEHLPSDTGPFVRVVELCLERAGAGADFGSAPGDVEGWLGLLAEAKQARGIDAEAPYASVSPPQARSAGLEWRLIEEWGAVRLGVHQVVSGGPLPSYTPRAHDHLLYAALNPQVVANRLVVLRGGSSTGKSRAAYEAVRARLPRAPVFYPRTAAALDALLDDGIPGRSVLWLNELRHYVDDVGGQAVLAKLANLLLGRDHLIVLTSVWPEYWVAYTRDSHASPGLLDPTRVSRGLLTVLPELSGTVPRDLDPALGGVIDVPEAFTGDDMARARRHGNALLHEAMTAAERAGSPGQVAQYLAGVPALLAHYQGSGADPYGRALITAAMDAVRLGHRRPLGRDLLQAAAVDYLTDRDRALTSEAWGQALVCAWDHATRTLKGAIRALEPVPPENGIGVAGYHLTDYLDQYGRTHRKEQIPPPSFWTAMARHAHPGDMNELGEAAWGFGLYRDFAQLSKNAVVAGDLSAAASLIKFLGDLHPADHRPILWVAAHATVGDSSVRWGEAADLLNQLWEAGAHERAIVLAAQVAADLPINNSAFGIEELLEQLWKIGGREQVTTLVDRVVLAGVSIQRSGLWYGELSPELYSVLAERVAARLPLDDPHAVADQLGGRSAGPCDKAILLDRDPVAHISLDDAGVVATLLSRLQQIPASDLISGLLARNPAAQVSITDTKAVADLLSRLWMVHAHDQIAVLLSREPAARLPLNDPGAVARLLESLRRVGADEQLAALLDRDPAAHVAFNAPRSLALGSVAELVLELGSMEAHEQVAVLLDRDPAGHIPLDEPSDVADLLSAMVMELIWPPGKVPVEHAGELKIQLGALAKRAAAHVRLHDPPGLAALIADLHLPEEVEAAEPSEHVSVLLDRIASANAGTVVELLETLRTGNRDGSITALLDRDLAAHVALPGPRSVARLLGELKKLGANEQFTALAERAAAHVPLDKPQAIGQLLRAMREGGSPHEAAALACRAAAQAPLTSPGAIVEVIDCLETAGAWKQIAVLLSRDLGAYVGLGYWFIESPDETGNDPPGYQITPSDFESDRTDAIRKLLRQLAKAGASDQAAILLQRLPAAGRFYDFLKVVENPECFRFGRERDGTAAASWGWGDLD